MPEPFVPAAAPFAELMGAAAGLSFWAGWMVSRGWAWARRSVRTWQLMRAQASFEARLCADSKLYAIYEGLPHLMWLQEASGKGLSVNKRWRDYTGLAAFTREDWVRVVHPDDQAHALADLQSEGPARTPFVTECRLRRHDGVYRWHRVRGLPLSTGVAPGLLAFGMALDVDDQKSVAYRLDSLESRLHAVIEQAPVILWSVDQNGLVTSSQGKALSLLHKASGEDVGHSLFEVYRDRPDICALARLVLSEHPGAHTQRFGDTCVETFHAPLIDGNGQMAGAVALTFDVSERKKSQDSSS